jgi:hypothetical protein
MIWRTAKLTDVNRRHRTPPIRPTRFGRAAPAADRPAAIVAMAGS